MNEQDLVDLIPNNEEIQMNNTINVSAGGGTAVEIWNSKILVSKSGFSLFLVLKKQAYPKFIPWLKVNVKKGRVGTWLPLKFSKELKKSDKKVFSGKFSIRLANKEGAKEFKEKFFDLYSQGIANT